MMTQKDTSITGNEIDTYVESANNAEIPAINIVNPS